KYTFRVEIDDSPELNALAFPGGLIIVTAGLLDEVETENELAFIIGHEMGHFKNRDHIRGLGRGVVLGIFFAAISSSDGGATLGTSIADLTLRGFSRRQESGADRFGLELVHQEYGHVADAWRFFERISEGNESFIELVSYLSTHPPPKNRIEDLIESAGKNGWSVTGDVTQLDW
ncbi:MAG: M48 family metallopeptidase, partial [Gammaproteobacteria bacterium]|nr:M48 family metallopeptidase [Gammaproteobacteria bacterium]